MLNTHLVLVGINLSSCPWWAAAAILASKSLDSQHGKYMWASPSPWLGSLGLLPACVKAMESGGQGGLRLVLRDTFYTPAFPDLLTVCKVTGSCNEAPTRLLQLTRQCSRRQTAVTDSDRFNGRTQRFRSRGNHDHGGHFSRGGKSADGLKTMLAADRDREASPPLTPSLPHPSMEVGRAAVPL